MVQRTDDKAKQCGDGIQRDRFMNRDSAGDIPFEDYLRTRQEGAFVSPCGTEGCLWEGFPEWPEEFPYDAFGTDQEDPEQKNPK
ncbi:MAG: hypothetical protein AB9866_27680 [Syntrophobacteraceae bacterium]